MEGVMAEIRMFAADFTPKNWAICSGQLLSIAQNQALFSLLGTTYGGNGVSTFQLPDLRGRLVVGTGLGPGLTEVVLGEVAGTPSVTLIQSQLPAHDHAGGKLAQQAATLGVASGMATKSVPYSSVVQDQLTLAAPAIASGRIRNEMLGYNTLNAGVVLHEASADVDQLNITVGIQGGTQPHENMQPYLGINYIICQYGLFPSRN